MELPQGWKVPFVTSSFGHTDNNAKVDWQQGESGAVNSGLLIVTFGVRMCLIVVQIVVGFPGERCGRYGEWFLPLPGALKIAFVE